MTQLHSKHNYHNTIITYKNEQWYRCGNKETLSKVVLFPYIAKPLWEKPFVNNSDDDAQNDHFSLANLQYLSSWLSYFQEVMF